MELKRLLNIKYIIIVCAALVLNIILFTFQATAGGNKINEDSKRDLRIRTEYIENYKSNIQNIVDRAEKLKKQRLFSNPESFSYKNIIKTGKDYEKLINIKCYKNKQPFPMSMHSEGLFMRTLRTVQLIGTIR